MALAECFVFLEGDAGEFFDFKGTDVWDFDGFPGAEAVDDGFSIKLDEVGDIGVVAL